MCITLPNALRKLSADRANNNGKRPKHPNATGSITTPRFLNVILLTHNVMGYSSKKSSSKKDHILRILQTFSDTPTILFTQETWSHNDIDIQINNTLFFSHGTKSNTSMKGGIRIVISPLVVQAWKLAGQQDPIGPGKIAGATQVMALGELHFCNKAN
jgi:hypothetical protein